MKYTKKGDNISEHNKNLVFGGGLKFLVEDFSDADWAGQKNHHLISRYVFYFKQGAISWSSKKQLIIVLLSMEAEYVMWHICDHWGNAGGML